MLFREGATCCYLSTCYVADAEMNGVLRIILSTSCSQELKGDAARLWLTFMKIQGLDQDGCSMLCETFDHSTRN